MVINHLNLYYHQHPKYIIFKRQIRHQQIMYLEQLCSSENNILLEWKHLSPRLLHLIKGRKPLWFTFLEDTILSHSYYRTILPQYQPPGSNPFAFHTVHFNKKSKPWLLTYNNNEIIIGKIRKYLKLQINFQSHTGL